MKHVRYNIPPQQEESMGVIEKWQKRRGCAPNPARMRMGKARIGMIQGQRQLGHLRDGEADREKGLAVRVRESEDRTAQKRWGLRPQTPA